MCTSLVSLGSRRRALLPGAKEKQITYEGSPGFKCLSISQQWRWTLIDMKKKKIFKSLGENNFPPIILNLARGSSKHEINIFRYEKFLERWQLGSRHRGLPSQKGVAQTETRSRRKLTVKVLKRRKDCHTWGGGGKLTGNQMGLVALGTQRDASTDSVYVWLCLPEVCVFQT